MKIKTQEIRIGRKQVYVVDCDGELTTGMPCLLLNEAVSSILENGGRRILINLEKVSALGFSGRQALSDVYVAARNGNALLRVACAQKDLFHELEVHNLRPILVTPGSLEEAVNAVAFSRHRKRKTA